MAITIFRARRILTLNPSQPEATHVAVRDGRILGAGTLEDLRGWGPCEVDERLADKVLLPGFVEGHSHLMAGSLWHHVYCGFFDVGDPDGRRVPGSPSLQAVVAALAGSPAARAAAAGDGAVIGWGFDPIYFGAARCARGDLDRVAADRPVAVLHASGHILNVNSEALRRAGLLRAGVDHPGIPLGADGLPTGELKGPEAMLPVFDVVGMSRSFLSGDEFGIRAFGRLAVRAGVTTATDLAASATDAEIAQWLRITGEDRYPVRLVPFLRLIGISRRRRWRVPAPSVRAAPSGCAWAASRWWRTARSRAFPRACAGPATSTARPTACGTRRRRRCVRPTRSACSKAC